MADNAVQAVFDNADETAGDKKRGSIEGFLKQTSTNIAIVSAIIGLVVTANQTLTSFSQDNIERYKTFRESVDAEDKYWQGLFERLIQVTEKTDDSKLVRSQKLAIIHAMAQRSIPTFDEHVLGLWRTESRPQDDAEKSLTEFRLRLLEALADKRAVGEEQANITQAAIFQTEQQTLSNQLETNVDGNRQFASAKVEAEQKAQSQQGPTYQAQVFATGVSNGWDIDVFWCAGGDEAARYEAGRKVAAALAGEVSKGYLGTAKGFPLGRIRLRVLPVGLQALGDYPKEGNQVRGETGKNDKGENVRANQLVVWLNTNQSAESFGLSEEFKRVNIKMVTPYYLSVFVCSAMSAAN